MNHLNERHQSLEFDPRSLIGEINRWLDRRGVKLNDTERSSDGLSEPLLIGSWKKKG